MHKYKLLLAYDGTDFEGWQSQVHGNTVQDTLEDSFEKLFGERVSVIGASRTDSGVHALGQVAQVSTDIDIPLTHLHKAWQQSLPSSIRIREITEVPQAFYPLRNVQAKEYWYHMFLKHPLPGIARYGWFYEHTNRVDWSCFAEILSLFVGTHDFGSFCKREDERDATRTIFSIKVVPFAHWGMLRVHIWGSGFLRFQIRRMIGCALDVARRSSLTRAHVQQMLMQPNPEQSLMKAPPHGLCLRRIRYRKY